MTEYPKHIQALAKEARESDQARLVLADWLEEAGFDLDAEALRTCPPGPIPPAWWWSEDDYGPVVQTLNAVQGLRDDVAADFDADFKSSVKRSFLAALKHLRGNS